MKRDCFEALERSGAAFDFHAENCSLPGSQQEFGELNRIKCRLNFTDGLSFGDARPLVQQPLLLLPLVTNREACWLSDMTITILCASDECGFITSDAPVVWFDPELHKMPPFYRSLALGSPTIEVTMPIAPSRLVLFTHGRVSEGYFPVVTSLERGVAVIDDLNCRARFHCDSHFVASSDRKKDIWFDPGSPPPDKEKEIWESFGPYEPPYEL